MRAICPSRCSGRGVGWFIRETHRIWKWHWNSVTTTLHCISDNRTSEDVFVAGRKPNRFHFLRSQHRGQHNSVCSVKPTLEGNHWRLLSTTQMAAITPVPATILEVLESWGNTWLWENTSMSGETEWLHHSISNGLLVAVTDGLYT